MTHDEKAISVAAEAAYAAFHANLRKEHSYLPPAGKLEEEKQYLRECYAEMCRAAITAYQAEAWQDISTAPTLERVFVAGWQPRSGNVQGYWWFYEDTTDENGRPMDHPTATKWQPLPPAPNPPASP